MVKFQAWIIARDSKTLDITAKVLLFEDFDRLKVEAFIESVDKHEKAQAVYQAIYNVSVNPPIVSSIIAFS